MNRNAGIIIHRMLILRLSGLIEKQMRRKIAPMRYGDTSFPQRSAWPKEMPERIPKIFVFV